MRPAPTRSPAEGSFLGFPLSGFSLLESLLLTLASAFLAFFATTFLAIIGLLVWDGLLHHTIDYADSYRYVGLPAGLVVLTIALPIFATLWMRAKLRK